VHCVAQLVRACTCEQVPFDRFYEPPDYTGERVMRKSLTPSGQTTAPTTSPTAGTPPQLAPPLTRSFTDKFMVEADPVDPRLIPKATWAERMFYRGEQRAQNLIFFGADGRPLNPIGRTGLCGRGNLFRWGPNFAVDVVVTRCQLAPHAPPSAASSVHMVSHVLSDETHTCRVRVRAGDPVAQGELQVLIKPHRTSHPTQPPNHPTGFGCVNQRSSMLVHAAGVNQLSLLGTMLGKEDLAAQELVRRAVRCRRVSRSAESTAACVRVDLCVHTLHRRTPRWRRHSSRCATCSSR
jgi:hypothetical protein